MQHYQHINVQKVVNIYNQFLREDVADMSL